MGLRSLPLRVRGGWRGCSPAGLFYLWRFILGSVGAWLLCRGTGWGLNGGGRSLGCVGGLLLVAFCRRFRFCGGILRRGFASLCNRTRRSALSPYHWLRIRSNLAPVSKCSRFIWGRGSVFSAVRLCWCFGLLPRIFGICTECSCLLLRMADSPPCSPTTP